MPKHGQTDLIWGDHAVGLLDPSPVPPSKCLHALVLLRARGVVLV